MKSVNLKLNKKFYNKYAIEKTKKAFDKIIKSEYKENNNYFDISLTLKNNEENIKYEYANYALALMK